MDEQRKKTQATSLFKENLGKQQLQKKKLLSYPTSLKSA